MTLTPDVSVVMCVHNAAATLQPTVASVLSQKDVSLELILVDDGSTEETKELLRGIALNDKRVRLFAQDHKGLTAGLILGCENARGRYVARQDAGDRSLDDRLRMQMQSMEAEPELSFVSCWTTFCGPNEEFLAVSRGFGRAEVPVRIISLEEVYGVIDGPSHHGSVMFRREAYTATGGYRPQFYFGQDWDLWYRLAEIGKFQMVSKVLYQACVTPGSISGRYRDQQRAIAKLSRRMLVRRTRNEKESDLLELACRIRPGASAENPAIVQARGNYLIGEQLRRNGDPRAAWYLSEARKAYPVALKAWVRLGQIWLKDIL